MVNLNEVIDGVDREGNGFIKSDKTGNRYKVDQLLEYFISMIPMREKQQQQQQHKKNQVHSATESPRRKRSDKFEVELVKAADLDGELYFDWAFDVILPLLEQGELEATLAKILVEKAHEEFVKESLLVDLEFEEGVETVIVGDIHGQFRDLLLIFKKFGRPGKGRRFIFNGDIVDRGPRSVACWLFICALKVSCPQFLFVTRGNHETRTINLITSSFAYECVNNYSQAFFLQCQCTFDELPLAYVLNKTIFVRNVVSINIFIDVPFLDYARGIAEGFVFEKDETNA